MAALPAAKGHACARLLFFCFKTSFSFFSCYGFGIFTREIKFPSIFFVFAVVERFLCSDSVSQFGPFLSDPKHWEAIVGVFFFKRVALVFQDAVQPFCFPQRHLWFPSLSNNTLSPLLAVFLYPRTSQQLSGYCGIFAVSLLERVFWRQSVIPHFLRYSACAFPLVCPFLWSLCSASRPFPTVLWRAVSFFLPRTLYARHLEASRIATHEALPSAESSRCVSISGFTCSQDGFFRHIHSMRSVGGRNSAGSGATVCIWHGLRLAAMIVQASFAQHQSLEKTTSSPWMAKIFILKTGQR